MTNFGNSLGVSGVMNQIGAVDIATEQVVPAIVESLPKLPTDYFTYAMKVRPIVEGKKRDFRTGQFWIPVYHDDAKEKMIVNGRQTWKSTYAVDILLCDTTARWNIAVCYVSHDDISVGQFSSQKLRDGAIVPNPIVKLFPTHGTGGIGHVEMKTNSVIECVNDYHEYKHVEGMSLFTLILDEAQYHDIQFMSKALNALVATKGNLLVTGIGGEEGSPYHALWKTTNQMEWDFRYGDTYAGFENMSWRNKLEFDKNGLVIDDYLLDVMAGEWNARNPDVQYFHGYHMPQTLFATIPLTIKDSLEKYKLKSPRFAVEWQLKNTSRAYFLAHVMGDFYKAARRPVTKEMVMNCMDARYALMQPQEIAAVKAEFQNKVKIGMGIDWGSGPASSKTVCCVIIYWRETGLYQIVHLEPREQENQMDQAEYFARLFVKMKCDVGVADLGYGTNQVKWIQGGGANRLTGEIFEGVGSTFFGCRTIGSDHYASARMEEGITDEHGDTVSRFTIDKTSSLDEVIGLLETHIQDPDPGNKEATRPKLLIPSMIDWETDFLMEDFTSITRLDLSPIQDIKVEDTRAYASKRYGHPADSVMSIIYAKTAVEHDTNWNWISV